MRGLAAGLPSLVTKRILTGMEELPHFARCLRHYRAEAKMSQQELADRAGIARVSVARMELGMYDPSWPMVQRLAHALNVPVGAFVDPAIIPPDLVVKRRRGRPRLDDAEPVKAKGKRK